MAKTKELCQSEVNELSQRTLNLIKKFKSNENSSSQEYLDQLVELVTVLRCTHDMNYVEISNKLGVKGSVIFNVIRDYPVSRGTRTFIKGALTRDERRMRDAEMVKMNAEQGITLESIADEFGISKQRVSAIFKKLKYVPVTAQDITDMDSDKHSEALLQVEVANLSNQITELKNKLAKQRQDEAVAKYYYGKALRELRIKLLSKILDNPTKEDMSEFHSVKKTLIITANGLRDNTDEKTKLKQLLERAEAFTKSKKYLELVD